MATKEKLNLTIEAELKEQAKILAVKEKKTISKIFEELLSKYIREKKKK